MKDKIVTLYTCDHCKKKLFRKNAMIKHESGCFKNPDNVKACFECVHLTTEEVERYSGYSYDGEPNYVTSGCFKCVKLDKLMYSMKAEISGLPERYPDDFEGQSKMPKECRYKTAYDESKYNNLENLPF